MIAIRVAEAEGAHDHRKSLEHDVFSEHHPIKRPLLQGARARAAGAPVLLIDEIDRTDEEFEAFLPRSAVRLSDLSFRKWAR